MRRSLLLLFLAALPLCAQSSTYNGNLYVTSFAGACQHGYGIFGAGGGAEALIWKGVSLGGEISYQSFTQGPGFGLFTLQPGYHFHGKRRSARWDPFATVGFGVAAGGGGYGRTANLGAGANYWFRDKTALRVEGRFQSIGSDGQFSVAVGISFR